MTLLEFNDVPKALPGKGNHLGAVLRVRSDEALDCRQDRPDERKIFSELIRLKPT